MKNHLRNVVENDNIT